MAKSSLYTTRVWPLVAPIVLTLFTGILLIIVVLVVDQGSTVNLYWFTIFNAILLIFLFTIIIYSAAKDYNQTISNVFVIITVFIASFSLLLDIILLIWYWTLFIMCVEQERNGGNFVNLLSRGLGGFDCNSDTPVVWINLAIITLLAIASFISVPLLMALITQEKLMTQKKNSVKNGKRQADIDIENIELINNDNVSSKTLNHRKKNENEIEIEL